MISNRSEQSALSPVIASYLELHRTLGRTFRNEGKILAGLDRFWLATVTLATNLSSLADSSGTVCLVSGSCPWTRAFVPRFLQTPPRDDALALC